MSMLHVLAIFPWVTEQSCPSCPAARSRQSFPGHPFLSWQSYSASLFLSAYPVLPVLYCLSCSDCPFLPVPFCLSRSACPVLPVLFCHSCSMCPVLTVLFCLSCSACPFCLSRPASRSAWGHILPVPFRLSRLPQPGSSPWRRGGSGYAGCPWSVWPDRWWLAEFVAKRRGLDRSVPLYRKSASSLVRCHCEEHDDHTIAIQISIRRWGKFLLKFVI